MSEIIHPKLRQALANDAALDSRLDVVETSGGGSPDASSIAITPDPSIELDSDDVEQAVDELAADTHALNNMQALNLQYQILRDA